MEAQKRAEEMAQSVQPGNPYKNVEGKDLAGNALALKEVVENKKNRYVLLDFWATWCSPCMYEVPYLKTAYEKYHNKGFKIYALSIDHDRDAWTKVIKEEKLQWTNVLRVSTEVPSNTVCAACRRTSSSIALQASSLLPICVARLCQRSWPKCWINSQTLEKVIKMIE